MHLGDNTYEFLWICEAVCSVDAKKLFIFIMERSN